MTAVEVVESGRGKFAVDITVGPHALVADEPADVGGNDFGPMPHDFVLAGLGPAPPSHCECTPTVRAFPSNR